MRNRITIETVHCKRCGKELATTSRSVHGLDKLKQQYGYICHGCSTLEERMEMVESIGRSLC